MQSLMFKRILLCLLLGLAALRLHASQELLATSEMQGVPVMDRGRIQPLESFAQSWLEEVYHAPKVFPAHREALGVPTGSALELLWKMELLGHEPWDDAPLFWVGNLALKRLLQLPTERSHFSYNELKVALETLPSATDKAHTAAQTLSERLRKFTSDEGRLRLIPSAHGQQWHSPTALTLHYEDEEAGALQPLGNWTPLSASEFEALRSAYQALQRAALSLYAPRGKVHLLRSSKTKSEGLRQASTEFAKQLKALTMTHTSALQLRAELLYSRIPLARLLLIGYAMVALLLLGHYALQRRTFRLVAYLLAGVTAALHATMLLLRIFILHRPPVSNMAETLLYVPFVAIIMALILQRTSRRGSIALLAGALSANALLLLVGLSHSSAHFEPAIAVLNSALWLTIHVLMVVGSYGVFLLAGVLGHIYLILHFFRRRESTSQIELSRLILRALYIGTALLITGTILGGVWAAQSWGRFWDWDPKESWAFVSACVYLFVIHAYQFRLVKNFGLAVGSVVGLTAITFTWYGVNYILGTGLHSYGFGQGGEIFYYLFLIAEAAFLTACLIRHHVSQDSLQQKL